MFQKVGFTISYYKSRLLIIRKCKTITITTITITNRKNKQ